MIGPEILHGALDRGVAAGEAELAQLPQKPDGGQARIGGQTLAQIGQEIVGRPRAPSPNRKAAARAARDVLTHRVAVDTELAGDSGGAEPLPVQFQDHHEFPKSNHRIAPSSRGSSFGDRAMVRANAS